MSEQKWETAVQTQKVGNRRLASESGQMMSLDGEIVV